MDNLLKMAQHDPQQLMQDMRDALVLAAKVVGDNFGKSLDELAPEYKKDGPKSVRTAIDTNAQRIMQNHMKERYGNAVYNLEEEDVTGQGTLEGKLLIFGDPFDGTANAQPRLPLSTQGLMAAQENRFVAAATLHPFEKYVLYGTEGHGVFRAELEIDSQGNYHLTDQQKRLPKLDTQFTRLKQKKDHMMLAVDAYPNPVNFCNERKALWIADVIERLDEDHGGPYMCKMIRATGSNIDYGMKLAEGRLHIQLTDFVGGVYDVAATALFLSELGGVMTDTYRQPLRVPKTRKEMQKPSQQVLFASISPEIQPVLLDVGLKYYGPDARIYMPRYENFVSPGVEYPGAGAWDDKHKQILENLKSSWIAFDA